MEARDASSVRKVSLIDHSYTSTMVNTGTFPLNICIVYIIINKRTIQLIYFVACSLLIFRFSVRRLGKIFENNCLLEREDEITTIQLYQNSEIIYLNLNHVETYPRPTFILAKSLSLFLQDRNNFVLSASITSIKGFEFIQIDQEKKWFEYRSLPNTTNNIQTVLEYILR